MKQIEIGEVWSSEIQDLRLFKPKDNEPYSIQIEIEIGLKESKGKDDFRFTLTNPLGVLNLIQQEFDDHPNNACTLNNYHVFCLKEYSYVKLIELINETLNELDTNGSWKFIANQINDYMYWEYQREELENLR